MANRRIRTPHYIAGFRDGNVRKHREPDVTDDLFRRPLFDRAGHVRKRAAPQQQPEPTDFFESISQDPPVTQGPWQVSAMALLCVMGLLLALFLQLMSDSSSNEQQQKVTYRHLRKTKKKKTDEWTKDEPIHYSADSDSVAATQALYYPPRYQQQQHRHRKISGSGSSELKTSSKKSPVIINSRPYYHHNVSGNKASFAGSPSSRSPVPPANRALVASGLEGFDTTATSPKPSPQMVRGTLSPVSSLCSLPTDDDHHDDDNSSSPFPYKKQNEDHETYFVSPGKEDFETPKAGRRRSVALPQDLIDTAVPFSGSSPPPAGPAVLPFIPDLNGTAAAGQDKHEDDDMVIQRMESGDMAYSPNKQKSSPQRGALKHQNNAKIQAAAAAASSPGPRNNIIHKRKDLTMATDAGSSLASSIHFDELELHHVIGGGGFGQVWEASWRGTPVAVKVASVQVELKSILEEFAAEINMLKGMRHPNICLYMGACLEPPNRAIVTELAANGSVWDALRLPLRPPFEPCNGVDDHLWPGALGIPPQGTWPWALVKRVACGAARGMTYLHSGTPPVLHRDLKSANLLLDDAYTTKVCDFGLSRLKAHQTSMTGNCGTVQWMAPEVLANQHYAEPADVYSFGIILWELLTGECPYEGMSAIQCALAVLNRNHRPPIPTWCPAALSALIQACLDKDPSKRPTFGHVLMALDAMP